MSQYLDDRNRFDAAIERQPRTVSKAAFACLSFTLFVLILLAEFAVAWAVSRGLGFRLDGIVGGLALLNLVVANVAADGILKRMGLSRSGRTVEARGRTVAFPEGEIDDDEVVEVRCPTSLFTGLGVMCLIICLVIVAVLFATPHRRIQGIGWAYGILGFFGLGAVYCLYQRRWGKPQAWADASGLTGYPVGPCLRRRFVPWSNVATCEIETYYDTFGTAVILRPILKGSDGKHLIALNLMYTKMDDQQRLVNYIKARLPKPMDDLWE